MDKKLIYILVGCAIAGVAIGFLIKKSEPKVAANKKITISNIPVNKEIAIKKEEALKTTSS